MKWVALGQHLEPAQRKRFLMRELRKLALIYLCFYVALGAVVGSPYYTYCVLHPWTGPEKMYAVDHILGASRQEYFFANGHGDKLNGWFFKLPGAKRVAIVSHGNAGNLLNRLFLAKFLIQSGCSVFLYDYRGYGRSQGEMSLPGLIDDGLHAYDFVNKTLGYNEQDLVLYGESIGTGVTTEIATHRHPRAVILQSPIGSLPSVAKDHFIIVGLYPLWVIPRPHFDNVEAVKNIHVPILVIHGQKDELVNYHNAEIIYASANQPKQLVLLPDCGHNDVGYYDNPQYLAALRQFFSSLN